RRVRGLCHAVSVRRGAGQQEHGGEDRERRRDDADRPPASAPPGEIALAVLAWAHEGRGSHPSPGGLRSAATMPTASSTRMNTERRLARLKPCSTTAANVRKAKPAMNTSAAPRTSTRVIAQGSPVAPAL